ncbi:MAG TPA: DoxX family protein [Chitinophagaceae bacterium]|nr:DoxX family protein [Chitinophagaceae bacterium]
MKKLIFLTKNNWPPAILRILLGLVLFAHGSQKLLGWFGGYGFNGTMDFFTETMGLPWIIGLLVIIIEFFGSISLMFGFATRLWSGSMVILFIGILYSSHIQHGFFMNWLGNQKGEGYEFFLLAIAISASLIITGGGKYAVDGLLARSGSD